MAYLYKHTRSIFDSKRKIFNTNEFQIYNENSICITKLPNHFIERLFKRVPVQEHISILDLVITYASKYRERILNVGMNEDLMIGNSKYKIQLRVRRSARCRLDEQGGNRVVLTLLTVMD